MTAATARVDATAYLGRAGRLITEIAEHEVERIDQAAAWSADVIAEGGILHVFGSGHSALAAREVFIRAGTLSCIRAFALEPAVGRFERLPGSGRTLLEREDLRSGEVLFVISQSGINPMTVELAVAARERGVQTVAVTSFEHSRASEPRTADGRRLLEVVDLAIDTHVPLGDASLPIADSPMKVGPLSTIGAVTVMNSIVAATTGLLLERGISPPVRISRNTPLGDEHNRQFVRRYGTRIPELGTL